MAVRLTLHVPLSRNDGTPVTDTELGAIEADLIDIGGGFTATDGIGGWRSGLTDYREPVRLYAVDVDDPIDAGPRMLSLAEYVAIALEQEAVYVTSTDIGATLVTPQIPSAI